MNNLMTLVDHNTCISYYCTITNNLTVLLAQYTVHVGLMIVCY